MSPLKLTNTKAALEAYDREITEVVEPLFQRVFTSRYAQKACDKWIAAEDAAKERVAAAFFEDTKDRNTRANCSLVDIQTLREWVSKYTEKAGK